MAPFLDLQSVRFSYPGKEAAVRDVSLAIAPGQTHCLIGRSGCGKTTLLKLAAGLATPQSGRVVLRGLAVTGPTPGMGFVFQSPTLLDWLGVLDNVLLPISLHGAVTHQHRHQALQLLEQMGLGALADRRPQQLSGGQQSRAALARALITSPSILFMDEPFAALDAITRAELQQDFLALCQAAGTSVLFVTHDIAEAVYLGDHVSLMQRGEIISQPPIDLPHPRTADMRYTPAFNARCAQLRRAMDAAAEMAIP